METINTKILKKQLLENIKKLPESDIQEILDFTELYLSINRAGSPFFP